MKFLQRCKLAFSNESLDSYISSFFRGDDGVASTDGGIGSIDADKAMKYSVFFACNRVLSETLASMPIFLYKKSRDGDREVVTDIPLYNVLKHKPNDEMTSFSYKEQCMLSINIGGNSVSEKIYNRAGQCIGLYPHKWQNVKISRNKETQKLEYEIKVNNEKKTLQRADVFHIAGPSFDGVMGLTPLEYVSSSIRLGLSYEQYGVNLFKNGAHSTGFVQHPNAMSEPAFLRFKEEFQRNYQGLVNAGKPIILEEGATFKEINIKPADAQLIESKRFQIEDICRVYRVPLHMVQDLSRSTNNNIEHQSLEFVMYTMLPHFKRVEEAINMQLLTEKEVKDGVYAEFLVDGLLRGDSKSRAEAYATGRQWGWLSINDIRKLENMNKITGGDTYLQPLNMINIEKADDYYTKEQGKKIEETKNKIKDEIIAMLKEG